MQLGIKIFLDIRDVQDVHDVHDIQDTTTNNNPLFGAVERLSKPLLRRRLSAKGTVTGKGGIKVTGRCELAFGSPKISSGRHDPPSTKEVL